jgi:hypothetical protein
MMTWDDAQITLKQLNEEGSLHGEKDWDLPTGFKSTTDELNNLLYENKQDIGNIIRNEYSPASLYWSSTEHGIVTEQGILGACLQWLDTGYKGSHYKKAIASVRPVRRVSQLVI